MLLTNKLYYTPFSIKSRSPCKCQPAHKNPFVLLGFLCGSSGPPIPLPFLLPTLLALPSPAAISLSAAIVPLRFSPPPLPLSILNPFQPSSSRSSLSTFSFSSRTSLSARFACSWLWLSELCNSSIVVSGVEILSLALLTSSTSCVFCFSRRWICNSRSLTVRSTFRIERASSARLEVASSSCFSSYRSWSAWPSHHFNTAELTSLIRPCKNLTSFPPCPCAKPLVSSSTHLN